MGNNNAKVVSSSRWFGKHKGPINCMAISPDNTLLVTGGDDTQIHMWATELASTATKDEYHLGELLGHTDGISSLALVDNFVVSGSADWTIRKWDAVSTECLLIYKGHEGRVTKLICNGSIIVSASSDKTAKVWDFINPDVSDRGHSLDEEENFLYAGPMMTLKEHVRSISSLCLIAGELEKDPDELTSPSDLLVTGSADTTIRSWALVNLGSRQKVMKGHRGPITCMQVSPNGKILYSGSSDATLRSWNLATGSCLRVMEGHEGPVLSICVVNRFLYSGSSDMTARAWVAEFGDCTRVFKGHQHSVSGVKFESGAVFTACGDGLVRAFSSKNGNILAEFEGHTASVSAIHTTRNQLFSASQDGYLRYWDLESLGLENLKPQEKVMTEAFEQRQQANLKQLDADLDTYYDE